METRANYVLIGAFTLAVIAAAFGFVLWFQSLHTTKARSPIRIIFEGPASGLRNGGSVNFNGIRIGEVVSVKLDNPRRVVALAMVGNDAPIRKDTIVGLEFQGLTGIAAISLTGGEAAAAPAPLDQDGIPVLRADLSEIESIRDSLHNVDRILVGNQALVKDALLSFETYTASLAGKGEAIESIMRKADNAFIAIDTAMSRIDNVIPGLANGKPDDLFEKVKSIRELAESFDKK